VPDEKGIWETHLKAWNTANEEVHQEWVGTPLNLEISQVTTTPYAEGFGGNDSGRTFPYYKNVYGSKLSQTVTGSDGHIPLPAAPAHTLVLADYVQYSGKKSNFTYTVAAQKSGALGELNRIDPDATWRRDDPGQPTQTVVIVLGGQSFVTDNPVEIRLKDNTLDTVKVYPNPYVKGKSSREQITFGFLPPDSKVKIFNLNGKLLAEAQPGPNNNVDWNIENIGGGIYLYIVTSPAGVRKGKVSVVK